MGSSAPPAPRPALLLRRLLRNLATGLRAAAVFPAARRVSRDWIVLRLDRGLVESSAASGWRGGPLQRPRPLELASAIECLDRLRQDPDVRGVLLRLGHAPLGWSKVSSLARALIRVREAGKRVVAYAESTGNAGAWLGGLADRFWLAPEGRLDLLGVRAETPFVGRALTQLRIRADVISAGRYKSIGESLQRDSMSRPAREALDAVVDRLYRELLEGLIQGRARDAEQAREWIDEGPYLASEACERGLVDELVYSDELPGRLAALEADGNGSAGEREARILGCAGYLRLAPRRGAWQPLRGRAGDVVVVPLQGLIRPGSGSGRGIVGVLRRLGKDDEVAAVVLRIDSRGGDPLASDLIWRAVRKLGERKPVVASLGDTAASGGYYVAMAAGQVVAEATTLTGSIGVVLASLEFDGLLEELGIAVDAVERGRHAGIYAPVKPRTQEERALLRRQVDRLYSSFVRKAAESRGLTEAEAERVAQGRVWTGADALRHKLVDALGGVETAIVLARERAGLAPHEGRVVHVGARAFGVGRLLSGRAGGPALPRLGEAQLWCPLRIPLH